MTGVTSKYTLSCIRYFITGILLLSLLSSCSVSRQISRQANLILLNDPAISKGFIGISIFEPAINKYWYDHDGAKYFVPASNTKLFTLYAGMKYLGDSLPGIRYRDINKDETNIYATGDPTFLHSDFTRQPVLEFLQSQPKRFKLYNELKDSALGNGWAWDDYNDDYMTERSVFPVYGNLIKISLPLYKYNPGNSSTPTFDIKPGYFKKMMDPVFIVPIWEMSKAGDATNELIKEGSYIIKRDRTSNNLRMVYNPIPGPFTNAAIPFYSDKSNTAIELLTHEFGINIIKASPREQALYQGITADQVIHTLYSQPTDSLFKAMMTHSDNFFAEQTLLMVSNERLGFMNDAAIIDTLLKADLKDIPQKPMWVDGSGLSRYNLFTPRAFIYILNKMKTEFGFDRLKNILPTGGMGTLSSYYKKDAGFIYAKTGTLSNHCALSGFLVTKGGKLLLFSILANHYQGNATPVRHAVEHFLEGIREKY